MLDQTAAYRATDVTTSSPVAGVVLLYQGAIRFGMQHLVALRQRNLEAAHHASVRCQAIVAGLQEVLDLAAAPVAGQLDGLYDYVLRRLIAGNIAKEPEPTEEALGILRELLEAWQAIARQGAGGEAPSAIAMAPGHVPASALPGVGGFAGTA